MKTTWAPVASAWVALLCAGWLLTDRESSNAEEAPPKPVWELADGDRVVLLGGTMIEREQRFGCWEKRMTVQHPDKNITFRNLGWSGDTVWAESRGIFDPPAEGYRRMIEQVKELKPTVIFLGYGANESFAGEQGLEAFLAQYKKLIDDLKPTGARLVFLGPPAHDKVAFPLPNQPQRDRDLKLYRDAIEKLAKEQQAPFVDLHVPVQEWLANAGENPNLPQLYSENGQHWTEHGYLNTAEYLEEAFGWPQIGELTLTADGQVKESQGIKVTQTRAGQHGPQFTATLRALPLDETRSPFLLTITGLKPGEYALEIDGREVVRWNHDDWAEGALFMGGPDFEQSEKLQEAIREKNRLYFHRWRPQNVTYLFLFRKHEQGQNAQEVPLFDPLVEKQEKLIHELKQPKPHRYSLRRVFDQ